MGSDLRNWIGFFLLGSINNLPYVIVTSAANTIADSFDQRNNVGVVFFANVALSVIVKSVNGFLLLKVSYGIRIVANAIIMLIGLFGVAFAFDFWFAIVCIVFVGASAAFGENVALGYLRLFPSKFVNAWSSGTGMAGVLGSTIYIIFGCVVGAGGDNTAKLKHLTKYAFLLTSPVVVVYLLAYFWIIQRPPESEYLTKDDSDIQKEKQRLLDDSEEGELDEISETVEPVEESALKRIWRCFKLVSWVSFNLAAVYMFEYVAQGSAAKVRPKTEYNKGCPELYAGLSLCYQAGVFVSRSSVQLFRIKRIEILSVLQLVNMIVWLIDVHTKFIPVYILPAYMIYVGLLGGASYVNIFYLLLNEDKYPNNDRELCINIAALFITVGIVSGTAVETLLFQTALKND
ncbi:battenin-like [Mytilus californianus]|uniref:battenin-like n=1 Tax=Mytilus californianus TaxID=6549 RepID=UPI002247A476|nr:battenin-like [Mytilus californianus]XP_052064253.1 battenin-like [Mytilus californianus]